MHPVRKNILFRWIGYAVVILGMGGWIFYTGYKPPEFKSTVLARLAPGNVSLPSEDVTKSIKSAISVLRGEKPAFASVETLEQSLIRADVTQDGTGGPQSSMPKVRITALFAGAKDKYAIINGVAYKEGAMLADGRTLKSVTKDSVILALGDSEQVVPWVHPFKVQLTKAVDEGKSKVFRPDENVSAGKQTPEAAAQSEAAGGQNIDLNNLPPDITPDQALSILQQMGNKK